MGVSSKDPAGGVNPRGRKHEKSGGPRIRFGSPLIYLGLIVLGLLLFRNVFQEAGYFRVPYSEFKQAVRDGRFVFAGPEAEFRRTVSLTRDARIVDAAGGTVVPGFVDAHTHLPFAGWRGSEFDERLRNKTTKLMKHQPNPLPEEVARELEIMAAHWK